MHAVDLADRLRGIVGPAYVLTDADSRNKYGADALKRGHPADVVVLPADTSEISQIAAPELAASPCVRTASGPSPALGRKIPCQQG